MTAAGSLSSIYYADEILQAYVFLSRNRASVALVPMLPSAYPFAG